MYLDIVLFAYFIDAVFSEFEKIKYLKHPIIYIGDYINWFQKYYYKDSILRGSILTISLILVVFIISFLLSLIDNILFQALLASFTISSKMLYESVKNILDSDKPKKAVSMLVSRDTQNMTQSDINKASIETYAENLSDGVIAPMFYLLIFGLWGAFIYKAINTLDSMVGYRNEKYEKFGKFSAKLDDIVNYIPSRITAILIAVLFKSKYALKNFYKFGKLHESPNAGHPISAMALSVNIKLGGATSYFGKIKNKPFFGEGKENIEKKDVLNVLAFKSKLDLFIVFISLIYFLNFFL